MHRLASILAFGGVALLVSWAVSAPAAPASAPPPALLVDALDQVTPIVANVNAQVDRMRERLASPPQFPAPERDPFRFGRRPESPRPAQVVIAAPPPGPVEPAGPELPRLVAITAETIDGSVVRRAVLSAGDSVSVVKVGDKIGLFFVRSISLDAAELVDVASSLTYRISLK